MEAHSPEHAEKASVEPMEVSNDALKIMIVMLGAVTISVGGILALIRGSETLMLAITLPAAAVCLSIVLYFILNLTGEGDVPDKDPV